MTAAAGRPELRNAPGKAIAYMLAAVATLTTMDAGVKWLTDDYSVPQIAFMRYLIGIVVAVAMAARMGGLTTLRTHRPGGHMLRSALNIGTMLTFYYALTRLPLADTIAICYVAPLFMTVLSVLMLGERVGPRRWSAIAIGFAGVLLILQPGGAGEGTGVSAGALFALSSALLYALTLITSRQLSATESSPTILFYYSIGVIVTMGMLMPWMWVMPRWADLGVILFVGIAGSFGQFFLNQAFRYGEVSLLAPLDYTGLIWAAGLGFVLWGDFPTVMVLIGATVIVLASLYVARREAILRRQTAAADPPPPAAPGE
ncbi:MAG: DMT family transporter [Dongiaceae bacterium]